MLNDLFTEIVRRMQWAKARGLTPTLLQNSIEYSCHIPIDGTLDYSVKIRDKGAEGVLVQSLFPDGEPHYYVKVPRMTKEEALCLVSAASLIVYGALMEVDQPRTR